MAHSSIWTNILLHFVGTYIFDEKFDMSRIDGGVVKYRENETKTTLWGTTFLGPDKSILNPAGIYGTGNFTKYYEATIENIASVLIVHEWYSHAIKYNGNAWKSHRLAYKNVINFKQLWDKTTDKYKGFVLYHLLHYTNTETGRKVVDIPYRNLYNKYIKYYINEK